MDVFMDSDIFRFAVLPALIFVSKIFDVSLGTLRIIFIGRGKKFLAPLLGFFEILVWILVIGQIMNHLGNAMTYIAYAGGFATGNLIGIIIEEKLAMGIYVIRIFLIKDDCQMKIRLAEAGFGVTSVDGMGGKGRVTILYSIIKRKNLKKAVGIINECDSKAFYSVEDARAVYKGVFPNTAPAFFKRK